MACEELNHNSTNHDLVVREKDLPGCIPTPPSKRPPISWIWLHGHTVSLENKQKNVTAYWLCKYCYTTAIQSTPNIKVTPQSWFLIPASRTNGPQRHLERVHHYQSDGTLSATPRKKHRRPSILSRRPTCVFLIEKADRRSTPDGLPVAVSRYARQRQMIFMTSLHSTIFSRRTWCPVLRVLHKNG
jgi:hypothetical protein